MKKGTKAQRHEGTRGKTKSVRAFSYPACLCAFVPSCLLLIGCTHTTGADDPPSMKQKQDQVARDPMNYKPDNENTQPYDISGGGFNNLDSKALKKDFDHVLDP